MTPSLKIHSWTLQGAIQEQVELEDSLNHQFIPAPLPKAEHFNRTKFTEVVKTVWKEQVIYNLP